MTHIELPRTPSLDPGTLLRAKSGIRRRFAYLLVPALVLGCFGCGKRPSLPEPSSSAYNAVVTRMAAAEPAGWANWGVLALRQRNFDLAAQRLDRAKTLAPQDGHIYDLLGMLD